MLTNQCERARDSTNQSSPPGMQRAVGYKMHCSFVSPIPFNYAVQKRRRLVREHSEELSKTRPSPLVVETEVTISRGAFGVLSTVVPPSGKIGTNEETTTTTRSTRTSTRPRTVVIGCKGLQIRPIRAVLPACNARHSIKGTAPSFLRISFSDRYQQHVDL